MIKEYLSALANAFRTALGISDKIYAQDFPNKVNEVYEAGKADGEVIGRDDFVYLISNSGTDFTTMFDGLDVTTIPKIDTSKGTNFTSMFDSCSSLMEIPEIDTSKGTNFNSMFRLCLSLIKIPKIDTSKGTNFTSMFSSCQSLIEIPEIDTSKGTTFKQMFYDCRALKKIPKLNISKSWEESYQRSIFWQCLALEDITFEGTINFKLDIHYSPLLTKASLLSIINALKDNSASTSALSLVLGETNLAKLTDSEKAIATQKGWTLA